MIQLIALTLLFIVALVVAMMFINTLSNPDEWDDQYESNNDDDYYGH